MYFSLKSATLADTQRGTDLLSNKGTFFFSLFIIGLFKLGPHYTTDNDLVPPQPLSFCWT